MRQDPGETTTAAGHERGQGTDAKAPAVLEWTARVPMVPDRFFLGDMLRWALLTGIASNVVLAITFVATGEASTLLPVLRYIWYVVGGLFACSLLVALIVFRNRYFVAYRLDLKAAHYLMTGSTKSLSQATTGGAVVLGALMASPTLTGAGLLASTGSALRFPWTDVRRVIYHDGDRVISLRNSWRTVFRLRCADDASYAQVKTFVETHQGGSHSG